MVGLVKFAIDYKLSHSDLLLIFYIINEAKEYQISVARVGFIVQSYNEDLNQEYKIVLPRIALK